MKDAGKPGAEPTPSLPPSPEPVLDAKSIEDLEEELAALDGEMAEMRGVMGRIAADRRHTLKSQTQANQERDELQQRIQEEDDAMDEDQNRMLRGRLKDREHVLEQLAATLNEHDIQEKRLLDLHRTFKKRRDKMASRLEAMQQHI